jgi:hypothetical protein
MRRKTKSDATEEVETEKQKIPQIILDDWQKSFIETKGDKILCTGRQVGKSEICGKDAGDYSINNPNQNILMIAPTERQAYALFSKTLNYLSRNFPKEVVTKGKDRPTKEKITLRNGTVIYCLPVGMSGVGIRFITVHRLYVDEASRVPEDVWEAITPALLTTGGDTILLSTPFGKQGEFYRCWINEDDAYTSFTRFSVTSETVMKERPLSEVWTEKKREKALIKLEQAKIRMSKRQYAQEYLGEFVDELFRLFSDEIIRNCCILKRRETIYQERNYLLGCDIARMGEDEGTFEILDKRDDKTIHQVENIITTKKLTTETYESIINLDKQYNFKQIGIDAGAGSLGVGILDFLLRDPIVRKKIVALNNRKLVTNRNEKENQKLLKEDMYICFLAMMERGIIKLLDDDNIIESLKSVQYEYITGIGKKTVIRIFGNYTHIAEGLIRAAYLANQKSLNLHISYV